MKQTIQQSIDEVRALGKETDKELLKLLDDLSLQETSHQDGSKDIELSQKTKEKTKEKLASLQTR